MRACVFLFFCLLLPFAHSCSLTLALSFPICLHKVERFSSPDALNDTTCGGTQTQTKPPSTSSKIYHLNSHQDFASAVGGGATSVMTTTLTSATIAMAMEDMLEGKEQDEKEKNTKRLLRVISSDGADDAKHDENFKTNNSNYDANIDHDKHEDVVSNNDYIVSRDYDDFTDNNGVGSDIWNGMIYPFLPMSFVGVIWYQGEANVKNATSYACRFPSMITDWRLKFQNVNMPFLYVQLAAYSEDPKFPLLRAAQDAALQLPNVGVALGIDLGDPDSPNGPIHPRRKQEIGRRLALSMKAIYYDHQHRHHHDDEKEDDQEEEEANKKYHMGPVLTHVDLIHDGKNNQAKLTFDPQTTDGLHLHDTAACTTCCQNGTSTPFEFMDETGTWYSAQVIDISSTNHQVTIQTDRVDRTIQGVHIHWENYPQCGLYNGNGGPDDHQGLPAAPTEWCAHPTGEAPWTGNACGTISTKAIAATKSVTSTSSIGGGGSDRVPALLGEEIKL